MTMARAVRFVLVATGFFAVGYLLAGGLAYQLLTKRFYLGGDSVQFSYLRNETDPALWRHTNLWMMPAVLLRGVLIALTLLPFVPRLQQLRRPLAALAVAAVLFVIGSLAASAPSPSNLEGLVYLRPELVSLEAFFLTQPEVIVHALLYGAGVGWWVHRAPKTPATA